MAGQDCQVDVLGVEEHVAVGGKGQEPGYKGEKGEDQVDCQVDPEGPKGCQPFRRRLQSLLGTSGGSVFVDFGCNCITQYYHENSCESMQKRMQRVEILLDNSIHQESSEK